MLQVYTAPAAAGQTRQTAYALLAQVWERLHGGPAPEIVRTADGKPYWTGAAEHFSLSHTRTMAACAVSDSPVGVDAETIRPIRRGVAERSMNDGELAWIDRQPDFDRAFLRLWTMKEAWVKLTGEGLRGRPKAVVLELDGPAPAVRGAACRFRTWERGGVIVTVCAAQTDGVTFHSIE